MKIITESRPTGAIEAQALVTYAFEEEPIGGKIADIDQIAGGLLRRLASEWRVDWQDVGDDFDSRAGGIEGRASIGGWRGKERQI